MAEAVGPLRSGLVIVIRKLLTNITDEGIILMRILRKIARPKLSVVIAFFNMEREARRTLYSLSTNYQSGIHEHEYEVIVLDSGSSKPLDRNWVTSIQNNYRYKYVKSKWPTPCEAMNAGIRMAQAKTVVLMIDGARILSPGVLSKMLMIDKMNDSSFVYTIAMHLGDKIQNKSMLEGYDQHQEDRLLTSVDWQADGYRLFDISCLAGSSRDGYMNPIAESNCFSLPKEKLLQIGGYDERFTSSGGGLVNLDLFNRAQLSPDLLPVMLLGEGSFHQYHGGVATNVAPNDHPWMIYLEEYKNLRGGDYIAVSRPPIFFGEVPMNTVKFLDTCKQHGKTLLSISVDQFSNAVPLLEGA